MLLMWMIRGLVSLIIFHQCSVQYATATWPTMEHSSIQLAGLFPDPEDTSEPVELSVHSRAMFKAAMIVSQLYNITIDGQYIGWKSVQTGGTAIGALNNTCQTVSNLNAIGIVGPAYSRESDIIAAFAKLIGIPAISYSATNPDLSDRNAYPALYRTVPSDNIAASAIVELFNRFNWTSCIIIHQNDAFGSGGAEVINQAFSQNNLGVSGMVIFDTATQSIRGDLQDILSSSSSRIIIVWADPSNTLLILQHALDADVLGPRFTWILSSSVSFNSFNRTSYQKLIGMLFLEPVIGSLVGAPYNSTLLDAAYQVWQQYELETFPESKNVNYYALFSSDAAWTFIQAVQKLCRTDQDTSSGCLSVVNDSYCFNHYFLNSTLLFNTINSMEFLGVSGVIKFSANTTDRADGVYYLVRNVQSSVSGVEVAPVLQWSYSSSWQTYTTSNVIVWPGNTLDVPTGFAGLNGVKLRVCTIESMPFTMQLFDTETNQTTLIGYINPSI